MSGVSGAANSWPTELRVNPQRDLLTIAFETGEHYTLRAEHLRVESPSAEVRGHGGGPKLAVTGKENVKISRLEPVGNYAVRIVFDDGHDSGLYGWDFLRSLGRGKNGGPGESMSEAAKPKPPAIRSLAKTPRGQRIAVMKGQDKGRFMDLYHNVLTVSWPVSVLQLGALFLGINLVFALFYAADRGGIANARPGSFADAFFFSVQTLGTLGYGVMSPRSLFANLLVTVESFTGILIIALFTGIIFARFSRPFARVIFSRIAVVAPFDGVPTLMFRAANQRGDAIVDATVTVSLARQHTTLEGVVMRRFHELKLMRSSSPLFALSWTVMHPIDEASPLYGLTRDEMEAQEMEIVIMLSGVDETISDRIYTRHAYWADEILWNRRFVDVISVHPSGRRMVDLDRFHDTRDPDAQMEI